MLRGTPLLSALLSGSGIPVWACKEAWGAASIGTSVSPASVLRATGLDLTWGSCKDGTSNGVRRRCWHFGPRQLTRAALRRRCVCCGAARAGSWCKHRDRQSRPLKVGTQDTLSRMMVIPAELLRLIQAFILRIAQPEGVSCCSTHAWLTHIRSLRTVAPYFPVGVYHLITVQSVVCSNLVDGWRRK